MKRFLSFLLPLFMMFALSSCEDRNGVDMSQNKVYGKSYKYVPSNPDDADCYTIISFNKKTTAIYSSYAPIGGLLESKISYEMKGDTIYTCMDNDKNYPPSYKKYVFYETYLIRTDFGGIYYLQQ